MRKFFLGLAVLSMASLFVGCVPANDEAVDEETPAAEVKEVVEPEAPAAETPAVETPAAETPAE